MSRAAARRAWPVLLALLAAVLAGGVTLRTVSLRGDLADFLPAARSEAARLMLDQLRAGPATGLILVGIGAAPAAELARISQAMQRSLETSGQFAFVANGAESVAPATEQLLFRYRALLSPATTAAAFGTEALRADFQRLLDQLASSASPLVARYGLADPPGAFPALLRPWAGGSEVHERDGVWFAPDESRALLLARTRGNALDLAGGDAAARAIRAAFEAARPGAARLALAGPPILSRDAEAAIRGDVRRITVASVALIAALLWWRFRSALVLAVIAVPVLLGMAAAALVVQAAFGFVHGIALGFGVTMLGVTVDYPVLLIGHRKPGEAAPATLARIGAALNVAVASAALGLTGMAFCGLPGLAQAAVFSAAGLLAAAAATRLLLPRLIVAADLAPVGAGDVAGLLRLERLRRWRWWGVVPVGVAAALLLGRPPRLERDLAALSPVPAATRAVDAALRREVGAPEAGQVAAVRGADAEAVLRREEALLPALDALRRRGIAGGFEAAAYLLPSAATQRARAGLVPADLGARIAAARAGLPFRPAAFAGFAADMAESAALPPLGIGDFADPVVAARLGALLFRRADGWVGLIVPRGVADPAALAAGFAGLADVTYVDIGAETNRILAATMGRAWRWLLAGVGASVAALAVGLRDPARVARVLAALGAAVVVTLAVLARVEPALSPLHVVAIQFVVGVGLDYAVFFARRPLDAEERARTWRTLVTCNAMTLLTFGLLAFCRTPILHVIGLTVAVGAAAALLFAFLFVGPLPAPPLPRTDG